MKIDIFKPILLALITFSIYSCSNSEMPYSENSSEKVINNHPVYKEYERESELITLCNSLNIETKNTEMILLPSNWCMQCKLEGVKIIDSLKGVYILHDANDECPAQDSTQQCISYNYDKASKLGLLKAYTQHIKIVDGHVNYYKPYY